MEMYFVKKYQSLYDPNISYYAYEQEKILELYLSNKNFDKWQLVYVIEETP